MKRYFLTVLSIMLIISGILSAQSLNVEVLNGGTTSHINFGDISANMTSFKISEQYLKLDFEPFTDVPQWQMDIYTKNENAIGSYQKGGLIGKDLQFSNGDIVTSRIPLGWAASTTVLTSSSYILDSNTEKDPNLESGWLWIKDQNDLDDPSTPSNESWSFARGDGYTRVVYGIGADTFLNNRSVIVSSTVYLYIEAETKGVYEGEYKGTIYFDMYSLVDMIPPTISHTPVGNIVEAGVSMISDTNMLIIQAEVHDDKNIEWVNLHYSVDGGSWQVRGMNTSGTSTDKTGEYSFDSGYLKSIKKIQYWLETSDGWNDPVKWNSEAAPYTINIIDIFTTGNVLSGEYIFPDGNPDDGNTSVNIPPGALSKPITLTIQQLMDYNNMKVAISANMDKPVAIYKFGPEGLLFNKPVKVTLLYYDLNNDGIVELPNGTATGIKESELGIYWWDQGDWRPMNGKLDTVLNTINIETNHFSVYGIFKKAEMAADDYRPNEKIITPATVDQINDRADFSGLNGKDFKINIYDVTGRKVKTITPPRLPQWDGKDENGSIVESGVYIYQFEALVDGGMKLISGTVVVAK